MCGDTIFAGEWLHFAAVLLCYVGAFTRAYVFQVKQYFQAAQDGGPAVAVPAGELPSSTEPDSLGAAGEEASPVQKKVCKQRGRVGA